jgi:hypothetical protein
MAKAFVREYHPDDREAVRQICFDTGLMGESIASQYADRESFADMLTAYYTDVESDGAFVAELDGRVVGYMLSCVDTQKAWKPGNIALRHSLTRGLPFRPGTAGFYWRGVFDLLRDVFAPKRPRFDLSRYPSHTHNNMLPEGRGGRVSREFFYRVFDRCKLAGSRGMHGEVWSSNEVMLKFAEGLGYVRSGKPYLSPGLRYPDGSRVSMQLMLCDLDPWVPGAWKEGIKPH